MSLILTQATAATPGVVSLEVGAGADWSAPLQILALMTVLSLAPGILMMTTSFVRIIVVLSFLRTALTLQQPPAQVLVALALFLTAFIMAPTWQRVYDESALPLQEGKITAPQAYAAATVPVREFMAANVGEKELALFLELDGRQGVESLAEVPLHVLAPAFLVSELRKGFQMGLMILLPFLVIDLAVAGILMSLGMMMLPPPVVSLPLKLLVFVLADGWALVVRTLVTSFAGG